MNPDPIPTNPDAIPENPCAIDQIPENPCVIDQIPNSPCGITEIPDTPCVIGEIPGTPCGLTEIPPVPCIMPVDPAGGVNTRGSAEIPDAPCQLTEIPDGPCGLTEIPDSPCGITEIPPEPCIVPVDPKGQSAFPPTPCIIPADPCGSTEVPPVPCVIVADVGAGVTPGQTAPGSSNRGGQSTGAPSFAPTHNVGPIIAILLVGILIGMLLFLPGEGLLPMMGLGNIQTTSGELPACPEGGEDGESQAFNVQVMLALNTPRSLIGMPLCNQAGDVQGVDGQTTGGSTGGSQQGGQTGGSSTGGEAACACQGVDYICTNADGSVKSASYNATECGGSGVCSCRDPNKTLVCPDGTYADFNPQCGVGGGPCTCVPNPACGQFPNNCPDPYFICQENGQGCKP